MSEERRETSVRRWVIVAMVVLLVLTASCGQHREVKLDEKDDGRQVELQTGQVLVIRLKSNPTTGYRWEPTALEEGVLRQVGEAEFKPSSKLPLLGASGVETLRFEAAESGQTDLQLVYHRPWEKEEKPAETYFLRVVVQ